MGEEGGGIVVAGGCVVRVDTRSCVPGVVAAKPWQFRSRARHQEVERPSDDHVVVKRHVKRYQHRAESHTCSAPKTSRKLDTKDVILEIV